MYLWHVGLVVNPLLPLVEKNLKIYFFFHKLRLYTCMVEICENIPNPRVGMRERRVTADQKRGIAGHPGRAEWICGIEAVPHIEQAASARSRRSIKLQRGGLRDRPAPARSRRTGERHRPGPAEWLRGTVLLICVIALHTNPITSQLLRIVVNFMSNHS
jgi:hypothetical protein